VITKAKGRCSWAGCTKPATVIARGRDYIEPGHPKPASYCQGHSEKVVREGHAEYKVECPNCGCRFGGG